MILTRQINNIPSGFYGFGRYGSQIYGVSMVGVPLIVNGMPGNTKAILERTDLSQQSVLPSVSINGVSVTSNTTYFSVKKIDRLPGSALLKMAGIAAPSDGDTVAIDYRLTDGGYCGELFRGVVSGRPIDTKDDGGLTVHNVICRDTATGTALQNRPVTSTFTGSAHDLAQIELAAAGVVGILEFDDFDIYIGDLLYYQPFAPSSQFATVENLLLWMASQTSYGNVYADASGVVHVTSFTSTRAADHTYPVGGVLSITDAQQPNGYSGSPSGYGTQWDGWAWRRRPLPHYPTDGTAAVVAAKLADYQAIDAALTAFLATFATATYHDVAVSLNPSIVCGHKLVATDENAVTRTGIVRSFEHTGQWPDGFRTTAQIAVLP